MGLHIYNSYNKNITEEKFPNGVSDVIQINQFIFIIKSNSNVFFIDNKSNILLHKEFPNGFHAFISYKKDLIIMENNDKFHIFYPKGKFAKWINEKIDSKGFNEILVVNKNIIIATEDSKQVFFDYTGKILDIKSNSIIKEFKNLDNGFYCLDY